MSKNLKICAGLALAGVMAFVAGCAVADDADIPTNEATAEAEEAIAGYPCTMSSDNFASGREAAELMLLFNGLCRRDRLGYAGSVGTPSCHKVANSIPCQLIN